MKKTLKWIALALVALQVMLLLVACTKPAATEAAAPAKTEAAAPAEKPAETAEKPAEPVKTEEKPAATEEPKEEASPAE